MSKVPQDYGLTIRFFCDNEREAWKLGKQIQDVIEALLPEGSKPQFSNAEPMFVQRRPDWGYPRIMGSRS